MEQNLLKLLEAVIDTQLQQPLAPPEPKESEKQIIY